jgi:hypothetical protein
MYLRISTVVICLLLSPVVAQLRGEPGNPHTFSVDIAEDASRFSLDEAPRQEDGTPAYGGAFVIQGYIYPAGTLDCADGCGVMPDGSPEFPDEVMGEWSCWGYFVGDGIRTVTGPWVLSTQLYSFGDEAGAKTVTTIGYEIIDFNELVERSVTGGTGCYRTAAGTQSQEVIGLNRTGALNLRVNFDLRPSQQPQ